MTSLTTDIPELATALEAVHPSISLSLEIVSIGFKDDPLGRRRRWHRELSVPSAHV